jgi:16S rRNA (guanine527-N7)-methyltransferase
VEVAVWFTELLPELSPIQTKQLWEHYGLLLKWNQRMSLTSISPGPELVVRHYCESLFFGSKLPDDGANVSVADIGSGAGFPGVPMAVFRPEWRVSLVESNQKKAVFLREATRGIPNIQIVGKRAQELSGRFDWLVSRAVEPQEVISLMPRVAARIGVMIGEDDFSPLQGRRDIAWSEPVRLPWGDHRVCAYGTFHVEQPQHNM